MLIKRGYGRLRLYNSLMSLMSPAMLDLARIYIGSHAQAFIAGAVFGVSLCGVVLYGWLTVKARRK